MNQIAGYYYLHENGAVLFKRAAPGVISDFENSDLVRCWWPCEPANRRGAWRILIEATARGADHERVFQLAQRWHCNDTDAAIYAMREGIDLMQDAGEFTATLDGQQGRGPNALIALAALFLCMHRDV